MEELPIKIEGILFRKKAKDYEFLLLLRSKEDGGYWQPLTGTMQDTESLETCLLRELQEETGISDVMSIQTIWHFHWEWQHEMYLEFVYAVELPQEINIQLSYEHQAYAWVPYEEAIQRMGKANNIEALKKCREKIYGVREQ